MNGTGDARAPGPAVNPRRFAPANLRSPGLAADPRRFAPAGSAPNLALVPKSPATDQPTPTEPMLRISEGAGKASWGCVDCREICPKEAV